MRLLLNTHALLWWLTDGPQLSRTARSAIADPAFENFPIRALWQSPSIPASQK
jgi:PIN domain nuclease of toxin-antitoxin system